MKLFVLPHTTQPPPPQRTVVSVFNFSISLCPSSPRVHSKWKHWLCRHGMAGGNLKFIIVFKVFCYFCRPLLIYHFTWNHYSYVVAAPAVWSLVHLLPQDFSLCCETRETLLRFSRWAMMCQGRIESIAKRTDETAQFLIALSRKVSGRNSKRF